MKKTRQQIINCLSSELLGVIQEYELGSLTEGDLLSFFSNTLIDAGIDSRIVVDVLEREEFGDLGEEYALSIKVNEGW